MISFLVILISMLSLLLSLLTLFKLGKLHDENGNWIPDELEYKIKEAKQELFNRIENVKEEAKDVKDALSNLSKQTGNIFEAAAGAKRKGRPKK